MKKTLFTLAMCAASLIGTASAEFKVDQTEFDYVVTGEGTLTECLEALEKEGITFVNFVRFGIKDGEGATVKITKENSVTPTAGVLEFANATLVFEDMVTLLPNYEEAPVGPGMMAGWRDSWQGDILPGELTIQVAKSAVDEWLSSQKHLDDMASFSLLDDAAEIQPTAGAKVNFQLVDGQGQVIVPEGGVYVLDEHHKYTNSGIVWSAGDLLKNHIALHFVPGGEGEVWGGGQFNVLALGENYIPVPEPATGTLSLLALAGLAARRRRK